MIKKLKQIWAQAASAPEASKQHDIALAVTALMVEIMRMDGKLDAAEHSQIVSALEQRFGLGKAAVQELIEQATSETEKAMDLHQFTSVVVKSFTTQERVHILAELWQVAMADGHIDPYEEQLIRRIADLVGLHHSQFIQAKIAAGAIQHG
ncbi:MAG: TerB family tellurite resistance protein [Mariprofundus sp.]